jgi:hypothetical protein
MLDRAMGIPLHNLKKLELASISSLPDIDPEEEIKVIVKVRSDNYVPPAVSLRARIEPRMFTGLIRVGDLPTLEKDKGVISIAISQPLPLQNR